MLHLICPCLCYRARLLPEHHHLALPDILHQVLCERNLLLGINHVLQDSGRVTAATFIRLAKLFHSHLFQLAAPSTDGPLTDRKGSIYTVRHLYSEFAWGLSQHHTNLQLAGCWAGRLHVGLHVSGQLSCSGQPQPGGPHVWTA